MFCVDSPLTFVRSSNFRKVLSPGIMRNQLVIWLLVSGVAYASGSPCDGASATKCLSELAHYETFVFPLYGEGEAGLDDTCENIRMLFECTLNYTDTCHENPECDDECRELVQSIHSFTEHTGLKNVASELCSNYSPLRETYLENYHCLESNADVYSACHKYSNMSLEYIKSIKDSSVIPVTCCYFSWYHDCFVNVTRDNCGVNATSYVSFGMRELTGHIVDQLCKKIDSSCDKPPLLTSLNEDENEPDEGKPDMTYDDLDDSINDRKNPIDDSSATETNHAVIVLVLSYCSLLLSNRFLCINYFF